MVVTSGTAEQYGLTSIADLAEVCGELVIAGPPEFAERAYGLDGLEEKYGCVPESFEPINDGGGPLTVQALLDGDVDVADIFTTTPAIAENDLVVLEDPENNFIAQQVLPLAAADRLPQEAVDALNELSGKLTTEDLVELNRRVGGEDQVSPADAAQEWLSTNGYHAEDRPLAVLTGDVSRMAVASYSQSTLAGLLVLASRPESRRSYSQPC